VQCHIFDDGYKNMVGPSSSLRLNPDTAEVCVAVSFFNWGDYGAGGGYGGGFNWQAGLEDVDYVSPEGIGYACRKWFGRCETIAGSSGHEHKVLFKVFDADGANSSVGRDALRFTENQQACVPASAAGGQTCRAWFGKAYTTVVAGHSHSVEFSAYDLNGQSTPEGSDKMSLNLSKFCTDAGSCGAQIGLGLAK